MARNSNETWSDRPGRDEEEWSARAQRDKAALEKLFNERGSIVMAAMRVRLRIARDVLVKLQPHMNEPRSPAADELLSMLTVDEKTSYFDRFAEPGWLVVRGAGELLLGPRMGALLSDADEP